MPTKNGDYNVRQSNAYILIYSTVLTVLCGGVLAFASISLKEPQQQNIMQEQKSNILSTVIALKEGDNINHLYEKRVRAFVIDHAGNKKEGMHAPDVDVAAEYKKKPEDRLLPVYEFVSESDSNKVTNVVIPVFGYGLWNNISGFIAMEEDFNTLKGVKFQHVGETPGLGARIADDEDVPARYVGKKVFEGDKIVSITMMKGEGNDWSKDPHKVDGMSGATLTAKGVNNMLLDYFTSYQNYLKKNKK
jgi:Na+-transporting NADH:ubiquinone oxidoreductase subunit C